MKIKVACVGFLALASGLAAAQEAPGAPPYFLVVDTEIEKIAVGAWSRAVASLVDAHDRHPHGASWAAYRELTGGPDVRVDFYRGLTGLADLDDWTSNRQVLVDVFGPVAGAAVKDALAEGVTSSDRVVARVDELSRPWTGTDPPRYLWVAEVRVAEGKMTEYAALAKRLRRAFADNAPEMRWFCFADAIGGERSKLVYYYGFDTFAEVDGWPSRRGVLAAALGDVEGARLASAIEAITETATSLWRFEPELSRVRAARTEQDDGPGGS